MIIARDNGGHRDHRPKPALSSGETDVESDRKNATYDVEFIKE